VSTLTRIQLPASPATVTATVTSPSSIRVTWTTVGSATSYKLYRNAVLVGTATSPYDDSGLVSGTYKYSVTSVNSRGEGPARYSADTIVSNFVVGVGTAAITLVAFGAGSSSGGIAQPFDYYMSPTGDDVLGNGSLGNPWSVTAFNTKATTYTGKRVGLLPGTYRYGISNGVQTSLYSMLQGMVSEGGNCVLKVDGGTSSASTYVGSSDNSGNYSPRTATIDVSNPAGGAISTKDDAVIGQTWYSGTPPTHPGYVTFDGINVTNFTYAAIQVGDVQGTVISGVVIKNCELYNAVAASSGENPGAIFLGNTTGAQVLNCKIHNLTCASGNTPYGMQAIETYSSTGLVVTNCTFYICVAIEQKDNYQDATVSYSYLDIGNFGNGSGGDYWVYEGTCGPGKTTTLHHNILLGMLYERGVGGQLTFGGTLNVYNNTFYGTSSNPLFWPEFGTGSVLHCYNNIFYPQNAWSGNPCGILASGGNGTTIPQFDYNYYRTAPTFNTTYGSGYNFATWQGHGWDTHSPAPGGSPFVGTPSALNMNSFAITGTATTAGIGGVPCGALDGSGSIGCNF
jgi:hypothetical protein